MRLIDADKFIEFTNKHCNANISMLWIELINKQPTAYDIDKVVEELEKVKAKYSEISCSIDNTNLVREYISKEQAIGLAIEIVERGGKE